MTAYMNSYFCFSNCSKFAAASATAQNALIVDTVVLAVSILIVPVARIVLRLF